MALNEEGGNGFYMPVAPAYGNNGGGFGNGFGGDWAWIILLLLLGWGNNGWGGNGNGNGGNGLYPWMNQAEVTNNGFQNALLNDNITEIRSGVTGLATQLCNCCGDIQATLANGQMNAMQTAFATQSAMNAGFNGIQSQLAQSCCDNRLATCQTQNIVQNEGNATRFADANNTRDIIDSQTRGTQAILDKLCTLELDGYKRENDQLRTQLTMANLAASQTAQTAAIRAGQVAEIDAMYNRLRDCPVPTMPVYGSQPIFTCPTSNSGCGCGCNGGF